MLMARILMYTKQNLLQMKNKIIITILVINVFFFISFRGFSQIDKQRVIQGKFKVISIDSLNMNYYYILKVCDLSSKDNTIYNILSLKTSRKHNGRNILEGGEYDLTIRKTISILYEIQNQDSIYYTMSFDKSSLKINGDTIMSMNLNIYPYISDNIDGLFYYK
jgi:hypothetical protein